MKKVINTQRAPAAIGPYSQAINFANLVFTSGQLPFIAATMTFPEGIEAQARQSLENLRFVLEQGGASLDTVIKTTCFIDNMEDFAAFNSVYSEFFGDSVPARSCIEAARLPKDALIEVEAIAYKA